jgi:hypothetical protein
MKDSPKILVVNVSDTSGGAARAAYRIFCAVKKMGLSSQFFVKQKQTNDNDVLSIDSFQPQHFLIRHIPMCKTS